MKGFKNIRVLDLSWLLPGPYCTMLLADLGADVIKIEQPGKGDYTRTMIPDMFQVVNRNKRSMTLNLKEQAGRDVLLRMVKDADVVVEGFRPGVVKRLGLDYETLSAINPRLVFCSISGYGQTGPYRDWPGHDVAYVGVGGGMAIPSDIKYPPVKSSLPVADLSSAMYATIAIQAALFDRVETGRGQYIDIGITDCVSAWSAIRLANLLYFNEMPPNRLNATSRVYEAADGKRLSIAISEDHFWPGFCKAVGKPEWIDDPAFATLPQRRDHNAMFLPALEAIFKSKPRAEWMKTFQEFDVPAAPVHDPEDIWEDPQIKHRDLIWSFDDEDGTKRRMYGWPVKFGHDAPTLRNPSPRQGADTDAVLQERGFSSEEVAALRQRGVI